MRDDRVDATLKSFAGSEDSCLSIPNRLLKGELDMISDKRLIPKIKILLNSSLLEIRAPLVEASCKVVSKHERTFPRFDSLFFRLTLEMFVQSFTI